MLDSKDPPLKLLVSIINFRTPDLTLACVESVLEDMAGLDAHIVVVDNESGDGSADVIADWISARGLESSVTLRCSPTNSGFSGGHNQGMAALRAEFCLVLNSDAILKAGFLRTILAVAESMPEAGLFAPRIDHDDASQQASCFRFPGPVSEFSRGAKTGPVDRLLDRFLVALPLPPDPGQIEWASFACILLRMRMVDAIGPMDENYFLYFEDVEYCLRARRAGWRIAYVPLARAIHLRGGSGPVKKLVQERARLPAYYYASRSRFLCQAHGHAGLFAANVLWMIGRLVANARRLVGKPVPAACRSESLDIWINFFSPLGGSRRHSG